MSQDDTGPVMVIVAGPNGSGKSTTTAQFSKDGYEVIDPDRIARNLSPNSPEDYSVAAGRQAINRARENILQGNSFLVETTLSSKGVYQRLVDSAKQKGFSVKLAYISTENPQINIARVADRVSKGGHNVPDGDVEVFWQWFSLLAVPAYYLKSLKRWNGADFIRELGFDTSKADEAYGPGWLEE